MRKEINTIVSNNFLRYSDIIKDDHPNLRLKSEPVPIPLSQEDLDTLIKMYQYLEHSQDIEFCAANNIRPGVGLAAPQLNIQKQMFVIFASNEDGEEFHYGIINPKILSHSEELTFLPTGEGCLSVDRTIQGFVHRPRRIRFRAYFYDFGENKLFEAESRLEGYLAIVFQHEYDHLQGILFYDRINKENPFYIPKNSTPIEFSTEDEELEDDSSK